MSRVTCKKKEEKKEEEKRTKWWSYSVEGLLSTGPTPSSFLFSRLAPRLVTGTVKIYFHLKILDIELKAASHFTFFLPEVPDFGQYDRHI